MSRTPYDLTHPIFSTGRIGHVKTLTTIPVVAGDSFEMSLMGNFRMAPLKRQLILDAVVDLLAFYVPHRHIYGDSWVDFIKQGVDEAIDLDTIQQSSKQFASYLGINDPAIQTTLPAWLVKGYVQIWNRYFKYPPDANVTEELLTQAVARQDGLPSCRLKTMATAGMSLDISDDDHKVDVTDSKIDILDIAKIRARYRTEVQREWFGRRYNDLLGEVWNTNVNIDADERPELLGRETFSLSGYDVDATDAGGLGKYSGKSIAGGGLKLGRKFFSEHGAIWVMAVVRYPVIVHHLAHYLICNPNPSYKQIAGDPNIIMNEPPIELFGDDLFVAGTSRDSSYSHGFHPYAQWYREHPAVVDFRYDAVDGFPILDDLKSQSAFGQENPETRSHIYEKGESYDDMFTTQQLGHWQAQLQCSIMAHRPIPGPKKSIFAGA